MPVKLLKPVIRNLRLSDKSVHHPEGIPTSPGEPADPEKLKQIEDRMNDPSTRLGALCRVLEAGGGT